MLPRQPRFVELRFVTLDIPGFLEPAHAPQRRRQRQAHQVGQFAPRHAAVLRQLAQDLAVDPVDFVSLVIFAYTTRIN
jgi:hypothetical protein